MRSDKKFSEMGLAGVYYFEKVGSGQPLSKDSLNKYSWIFFAQTQINPRISRFEALKGSGKLDIIEDKKLQYNIIELYQKNFPQIARMNGYTNVVIADKIDPYLGDTMELDSNGSMLNAEAILRKSKMRILLLQAQGIKNSIKAYSDGIDKANEVIKQIDEELK